MKQNIYTVKTMTYKGHTIRVIGYGEREWRCHDVVIDNDNDEIELSPVRMAINEFTYGTVADAKRAINGLPVYMIDAGIYELRYEEFYNRFKN